MAHTEHIESKRSHWKLM